MLLVANFDEGETSGISTSEEDGLKENMHVL